MVSKFVRELKILLPVVKFEFFTLTPTLLFNWSTSPELWTCISSSAHIVGENPTQLLYLLDDLPGRAHSRLSTRKRLFEGLTCDDVAFALPEHVPVNYLSEGIPMTVSFEGKDSPPHDLPLLPEYVSNCTPRFLTDMLLMGLNAYFL
ncbi:hypothetical protein DSO57_1017290 [Entomophthora muscae]|uniref:Uncharacterized protein n=1 Tax=Entomophthora muscae TaxID=34485 RepID=A0ACC2URN7_9FUNG|nr:hypothetical protein DSO57_1017290 [Entomophthora muscae]